MSKIRTNPARSSRSTSTGLGFAAAGLLAAGIAITGMSPANAAEAPIDLGTVASFSVMGASTVTNTGPSSLSGDLGLSPGSSITGFPPGKFGGTRHISDAVANTAQDDLTTAYNDAAGRSTTKAVTADLAGQTLTSGVHTAPTLNLTGALTLDAKGDPDAVFIFQAASTLITASASSVTLINGASACNVFWQVGSSATLGTSTDFIGTIMALTSVTLNNDADVRGRVLARNGAVTLNNNEISTPNCDAVVEPSATPTPTPTVDPSATPTPSDSPSSTPTPSDSPSSTPTPSDSPSSTPTPSESPSETPVPSPSDTPSETPTVPTESVPPSTPTPPSDTAGPPAGNPGPPNGTPTPPTDTPTPPSGTPTIPVGHPPTGLGGTQETLPNSALFLFTLAGLAATGAIAVPTLRRRPARKH
ncbi:ice-binding family protein [Nocardioides gilvus]|uniref:ice-binding family protein n=1 Tax=Nocardioides gilvus TaxID=1735589 RepID=UPI000D74DA63|nr:ice-binding family protein [Nocardioides gilvus]